MQASRIRNFCIIAHIDHGKSTLADRLLELTGTVAVRDMKEQLLDKMDLEREKGITIKLAPVRMNYNDYELNLIDTPGHVDFSYEVSRSLAACEGALLVVDASQGIQAQTLANVYLALSADLEIIPVMNKIDLPAAEPERTAAEIISLLGCKREDILSISAKTGQGVDKVLDKIVEAVPPPKVDINAPTRALIFDSYFDEFRGVILYVRVVDGQLTKNDGLSMLASEASGSALEVGFLSPDLKPTAKLTSGEIGYIVTNLKSAKDAHVGDTLTLTSRPASSPLSGYVKVQPFVYAGFFPESNAEYQALKSAVERLALNDSALVYTAENSPVLGFGLRIGFLGMLHLDIVRERLEREYDLSLVVTNPSTDYHVSLTNGDELDIKSAAELPDQTLVKDIKEPWVRGEIILPKAYVGPLLGLIVSKRGHQTNLSYVDEQALISFEAPLANLLTDFYDQLKSLTSGYGSFNYELNDYRSEELKRLDFLVAGERVDALSVMAHKSEVESLARSTLSKLRDIIPRQNFKVSLQAATGGKIVAREDISAFRKDVTVGLYGGDVTRKRKVLEKQKKGKRRLKRFGKVDIPAEAFFVMMQKDKD